MLKKFLIGLFLLGMLCGAGSISASPFGARVSASEDGSPAAASMTTDSPKAKVVMCGGGSC